MSLRRSQLQRSIVICLVFLLALPFQNCKSSSYQIKPIGLDNANSSLFDLPSAGSSADSIPAKKVEHNKIVSISFPVAAMTGGNHIVVHKSGEVYVESLASTKVQTLIFASPKSALEFASVNSIAFTYGSAKIPSGWKSTTEPPQYVDLDTNTMECPKGYSSDGEGCFLQSAALVKFPNDGYCQYRTVDCLGQMVPYDQDPDCDAYKSPTCDQNVVQRPPAFNKVGEFNLRIFDIPARKNNFARDVPPLGIIQIQKPIEPEPLPDLTKNYDLDSVSIGGEPIVIPSGEKMSEVSVAGIHTGLFYDGKALDATSVRCQDGSSPVMKTGSAGNYAVCTPELPPGGGAKDSCPNSNYQLETKKIKATGADSFTAPIELYQPTYMKFNGVGNPGDFVNFCAEAISGWESSGADVVFFEESMWSYGSTFAPFKTAGFSGNYEGPPGLNILTCRFAFCINTPALKGQMLPLSSYSGCESGGLNISPKTGVMGCADGKLLWTKGDKSSVLSFQPSRGHLVMDSGGFGAFQTITRYPVASDEWIVTCNTDPRKWTCPDSSYTLKGDMCVKKVCSLADQSQPKTTTDSNTYSYSLEDSIAKSSADEQGQFAIGVATSDAEGQTTITGDGEAASSLMDQIYDVESTLSLPDSSHPALSKSSDADPFSLDGVRTLENDMLKVIEKNQVYDLNGMKMNFIDLVDLSRRVDSGLSNDAATARNKVAVALGYNPSADQLARMDHYGMNLESSNSVAKAIGNTVATVGYEGVKLVSNWTKTDIGSYIPFVNVSTYNPTISPPSFGGVMAGLDGIVDGFSRRNKGQ